MKAITTTITTIIDIGLVADVEGDKVRLSPNAEVAHGLEEEEGGEAAA